MKIARRSHRSLRRLTARKIRKVPPGTVGLQMETLAFVGERDGELDIYSIPFEAATKLASPPLKASTRPDYTPTANISTSPERTGHM